MKNVIINIEIDEITPCLIRIKDKQKIETKIINKRLTKKEVKDWEFDWLNEQKKENQLLVYM